MTKYINDYHHLFSPYYSTNYTQKYLKTAYTELQIKNAGTYSYDNCNKFIAYIENGILYFKQIAVVPIQLKPLILYYGFTHFLKACLLVIDPLYPETTTVLSHGVSTRKRKKQQYEFLFDEVKIQRHGLFSHTAEKLFGIKQLENEKLAMIDLLQELPELSPLFKRLKNKWTCAEISMNPEKLQLQLSDSILDEYKMTAERFMELLKLKWGLPVQSFQHAEGTLHIALEQPFQAVLGYRPVRFNIESQSYHLSLQKEGIATSLPDLLILYLLLYNLSMISRYETEWWSDLFKEMPFYDLPFIVNLLDTAENKIPFLITNWLDQMS